jgi:hypothetical protein
MGDAEASAGRRLEPFARMAPAFVTSPGASATVWITLTWVVEPSDEESAVLDVTESRVALDRVACRARLT